MAEFRAVSTLVELMMLDDDDVAAGYSAGLDGAPPPASDRSKGYWHGWRNGLVDSGRRPADAAQLALSVAVERAGGLPLPMH